jgi:hypothetical protein
VSSAVVVDANGNATDIPTTSCTPDGICSGLPIPVGTGGQVYLSLYGNGLRHAPAAQCLVGKTAVTPSYIGPQAEGSLIDQMNIPIPANTTKGSVNISCSFGFLSSDGSVSSPYTHGNSNSVTIVVQ